MTELENPPNDPPTISPEGLARRTAFRNMLKEFADTAHDGPDLTEVLMAERHGDLWVPEHTHPIADGASRTLNEEVDEAEEAVTQEVVAEPESPPNDPPTLEDRTALMNQLKKLAETAQDGPDIMEIFMAQRHGNGWIPEHTHPIADGASLTLNETVDEVEEAVTREVIAEPDTSPSDPPTTIGEAFDSATDFIDLCKKLGEIEHDGPDLTEVLMAERHDGGWVPEHTHPMD